MKPPRSTLRQATAAFTAALALPCALLAQGNPNYAFVLTGPERLEGAVGAVVSTTLEASISHSGPEEEAILGWSLGVALEDPDDNATLVDARFRGTEGEQFFNGGFRITELATLPETDITGAVSAVVLSIMQDSSLPLNDETVVLHIDVEAGIPPSPSAFGMGFLDGLRGSGLPVENLVTAEVNVITPTTRPVNVRLDPGGLDCCDADVNVAFSDAAVDSGTPFQGILGIGDRCEASSTMLRASSTDLGVAELAVHATIVSQFEETGARAWSLGVELTGEAALSGVEAVGMPAADFTFAETIDPAKNEGRLGAVTIVVLGFEKLTSLPAEGTVSVLRVDLSAMPPDGAASSAALSFRDGLIGSGESIPNLVITSGADVRPCNLDTARAEIRFVSGTEFLRGNSNADDDVDINDPTFTLNQLFAGGPTSPCTDAADANDDGRVNLVDPIYTLNFLFSGGPDMPPPTGSCGLDTTTDTLTCEDGGTCGEA